MKKIILFFGLVATLCDCNNQQPQKDSIQVIPVLPAWENLSELKCSQLGKSVRYVPLETTDSSLIGNSYNIHLLKNHILVTTDKRALLFDKETGKYLRQIGHYGDDPTGYLENFCFVNQQTEELHFPRNGKLMKYDLSGQFQGERAFPSGGFSNSCYPLLIDSTALVYRGQSFGGNDAFQLFYTSDDGVKTDSIVLQDAVAAINPSDIHSISVFKGQKAVPGVGLLGYSGLIFISMKDESKVLFSTYYPSLWQSGEDIHFREPFNDTIFSVRGTMLEPCRIFDMGERRLPKNKEGQTGGTSQYIAVTYVMETPQVIYFQCIKDLYGKQELFNGVYSKEEGVVAMDNASGGFSDDLTHFMPFIPEAYSSEGEFASTLQVMDIQDWVDENGDSNIPDALKNLKDDDNPVCVIVE